MKQLFKINGIDFTKWVNDRKYDVRRNKVYFEWTDGNFTTRRANVREQVAGSFIMTFLNEADYDAFTAAVKAAETGAGWCPVEVFLNKEKTTVSINAFVDYETKIAWTSEAFNSEPAVTMIAVEILEI